MAENSEIQTTIQQNVETGKPGAVDEKPTYEQLVEELAKSRANEAKAVADSARFKNSIDDLTKKNGELTKHIRERMSAEDQEQIAKEEADKAKDARIAELENREKMRDYTELLMDKDIGMAKQEAKELAEMLVNGDFEKSLEIFSKHIKSIKDSAYQQALKDRPDIAAGNGDPDKNALAIEKAKASAGRRSGVNEDILKHYRR